MKLEKKHWIIIAIVLGVIAVWYFFLRKKKTESGYAGIYGSFGNESGYAGIYGSFGNESNFSLDQTLPMIGESDYVAGVRSGIIS